MYADIGREGGSRVVGLYDEKQKDLMFAYMHELVSDNPPEVRTVVGFRTTEFYDDKNLANFGSVLVYPVTYKTVGEVNTEGQGTFK